jgi:hypothetical protein
MDRICDFLKDYYKENGITEKQSIQTFKSPVENEMTDKQMLDYIQKKLRIYMKSCLSDMNIKITSVRTSIQFQYKENLCEIYLQKVTKKIYHWTLVYY